MRVITSLLIAHATPFQSLAGLFLFRRDRQGDTRRTEALDDLFGALRAVYESAALLKDDWIVQWRDRTSIELPPKYRADQFLYPGAVDAAFDAKFARSLLYRNRWRSRIEPIFETYDPDTWSQVRAAFERASHAFMIIKEAHEDALRDEEATWIRRAVEGFDEARYMLRTAERRELPDHELISLTTFQAVYSALQLSESLLDGLRKEAIERS